MAYNVQKAPDCRYLKRYLKTMRKIRYRRERTGLCLLLVCAVMYLAFAGAYRGVLVSVTEDHRISYVLPGESAGEERLQLDFNLLRGEFRITREVSGPEARPEE